MNIEAMKLALEALVGDRAFLESDAPVEIWGVNDRAITALQQSIEQAQKQEPVVHQCKGIPRKGCNYLAACDSPCNKCGEIHHHHQMVASFYSLTSPPQRQPEQEPVVCVTYKEVTDTMNKLWAGTLEQVQIAEGMKNKKLYTTPPQRQPLTDEQIKIIWRDIDGSDGMLIRFARAIEAAHGIKGEE